MKHTIETSTAALDNFVYYGLYETYLGEYYGGIPYNDRANADKAIGELAVDVIAYAFNNILPSEFENEEDFSLEYKETYHPSYYNFCTDSIVFNFNYSNDLKHWFHSYAITWKEEFEKFLADNYTSYDGFISFTPNNWNEWLEEWSRDEWRSVSAFLNFLIHWNIDEYEREALHSDFEDNAIPIIEEQYIPWCYAERYENGFIGCVLNVYDMDDCPNAYNAYLIDDKNNVINRMVVLDDCFEIKGAFDAWNNMDYDLVHDYGLWGMKHEPCDMPSDEILGIQEA